MVVADRTMTTSDNEIVDMVRMGLLYLSENGEVRKFHFFALIEARRWLEGLPLVLEE
jgi:hypothetical protein